MKNLIIKTIWIIASLLTLSLVPAFCWGCPEVDDDFDLAEGEKTHPAAMVHSTISDDLMKKMEAMVNSEEFIFRIRETLTKADFVSDIFNDYQVTGADDAAALIEGLEAVHGAYLMLGTADPEIFAEGRKQGKDFPFTPHEPDYQVDLDGIPFGAKVAALLTLDILGKN
jgi:metal-dependent amidase/aminoacylase/carboxypeptidase family protein